MTGTYCEDSEYYVVERSPIILAKLLVQLPLAILLTIIFVGLFFAILVGVALHTIIFDNINRIIWGFADFILICLVLATPIYFAVWIATKW